MNADFIYHMCPKINWISSVKEGVYRGSKIDHRDGFIHFSSASEVEKTSARYLSGISGLVLLQVDPLRLGDALRWEKSRDNLLFPHLYGDLKIKDVELVYDLVLGSDGRHIFPEIR